MKKTILTVFTIALILVSFAFTQAADSPSPDKTPNQDKKKSTSPEIAPPPGTTPAVPAKPDPVPPASPPKASTKDLEGACDDVITVAKSTSVSKKARYAAIDALGRMGTVCPSKTQDVVDALKALLDGTIPKDAKVPNTASSVDVVLRHHIVTALVNIGSPSVRAIPSLLKIIGDSDDDTSDQLVRDAITRILNASAPGKDNAAGGKDNSK
jgi:hypothetical protein